MYPPQAPGRRPLPAVPLPFIAGILLAGAGLAILAGQGYMKVKAALAAVLIDRAWSAHLADGREHRPWPWADMHPVARLEVPRLGVRRAVLSGTSGESLAFGLAHVSGTALPGDRGNVAIAGHRETWAAFLRDLRPDDQVWLLTRSGRRRYSVRSLSVLGKERVDVLEPSGDERLTLITCYPFNGLLRSPWRLVVVCDNHRPAMESAWERPLPNRPPQD
jgi:sortase A